MSKAKSDTADMTMGVYRRIYAGYLVGRRINAVSLAAEAWFWRVVVVADDYGNLQADPLLVYALTAGRRMETMRPGEVGDLITELVGVGLLVVYDVGPDRYLHVDGWNARQATRNGKPIHRVAPSPWDIEGKPTASRGNQGNPDSSSGVQCHNYKDNHNHKDNPPTGECVKPAAADSTPAALLVFACSGGTKDSPASWTLTADVVAAWTEAFPAVDVLAVCRHVREWCEANPAKRKTPGRMRTWIGSQWLAKEQNATRGGNIVFQTRDKSANGGPKKTAALVAAMKSLRENAK